MKYIAKNITVKYQEKYLPTPQCRKYRTREASKEATVQIRCVSSADAPVAFILHDWSHNNGIRKMPDIRRYGDSLYAPITEACLFCGGKRTHIGPEHKRFYIQGSYNYFNYGFEHNLEEYRKEADKYLVIDDKLWKRCGEPRYCICTFGLGHNHGGTALMVDTCYNSNISKSRYFNALHGEEAVAEAKRIALARGDTESINRFRVDIEVLEPSAVKCDPEKEHGDGDPFMNSLERLSEIAGSAEEAAFLTIATTLKETEKK